MLKNEAAWLGAKLAELSAEQLGTILNLGSSTAEFRQVKQPYVDELMFAPLAKRAVRVVHFDLQHEYGVDIAGDIFEDSVLHKLRELGCNTVICSNIFEHVTERSNLAFRVQDLVPCGGYLFVTVPYSFPYHPDPIDTYYRASPEEVTQLFPEFKVIEQVVVEDAGYGQTLRSDPKQAVYALLRLSAPFFRPKHWLGCLDRLRWLGRTFKASCVVLKKE